MPEMPDQVFLPSGLTLSRLEQLHIAVPGDSDERPVGDCYRTAIACLLGAPSPAEVPHFVDDLLDVPPSWPDAPAWDVFAAARTWLRTNFELDLFPSNIGWAADGGTRFLAGVQSRRGSWGHVVVAMGRRVIHDPSAARMAELGLAPYTWDDVVAYDSHAEVIVRPYDPAPDVWLAETIAEAAAEAQEVPPCPA